MKDKSDYKRTLVAISSLLHRHLLVAKYHVNIQYSNLIIVIVKYVTLIPILDYSSFTPTSLTIVDRWGILYFSRYFFYCNSLHIQTYPRVMSCIKKDPAMNEKDFCIEIRTFNNYSPKAR